MKLELKHIINYANYGLTGFFLGKHDIVEFQNGFTHYKGMKYGIIERLFEWHFDINGLINEGLAIDKNTL